jgi:O-methyltransferase involved in polyketide biosynthesis
MLQKQTVQETMLIPLWGRAQYSHLYPELLDDPLSKTIIDQIKFSESRK